MSKYLIRIEGMACGNCVKHIEEALEANSKVDKFNVEIGKAVVEGTISENELKDLIEDVGYDVTEVSK
ncbi:hypothetical protein HMPREF1092_02022 [Clostridium thermobutyricum]|uniref:HMA domain-containing protein n=1 Tax=Clostridium thermobutyricum TaxID=29372 RepID=N9XZI5_9CLOT|nr:hypothetical protein HMPREF1092_02022 [Clostridium thermobutyricum]